jgi:hypothetical protein
MTNFVRPVGRLAALAAAAFLVASPVLAGEVNGKGNPIPATDHAASACSFSGLNDHPTNPPPGDFSGKVQNFHFFLLFFAELLGVDWLHPLDAPLFPGDDCLGNIETEA